MSTSSCIADSTLSVKHLSLWAKCCLLLMFLIAHSSALIAQTQPSQSSLDLAQQMYVAYYGRPGDPGGVSFWAGNLDRSSDLGSVLSAFGNSQEYNDNFGALTDEQLIHGLYQQVFNRDADPSGLNFYVDRLASGEATLASIAKQIADGAVNDDLSILINKISVANAFTVRVESDSLIYNDVDIANAQALLAVVEGNSSSLSLGLQAVEEFELSAIPGGVLLDVIFADSGLSACVQYTAEREGWTSAEEFTRLGCSDPSIVDLSGIEALVNLRDLSFTSFDPHSPNQVSDISALASLTNLKVLGLGRNRISNISALSGLTNMIVLKLYENQISDISALSGMTNLENLELWNNQVSDISALAGLTSLENLFLGTNQISDVSAVSDLTNLTSLLLSDNQISELPQLNNLIKLSSLSLDINQISDISAVSSLIGLRRLNLQDNQISELPELYNLTNLSDLSLAANQISDIAAVSDLTNLSVLDLDDNRISELTALPSLRSLYSLSLATNQISDITALAGLVSLRTLHLQGNTDIACEDLDFLESTLLPNVVTRPDPCAI